MLWMMTWIFYNIFAKIFYKYFIITILIFTAFYNGLLKIIDNITQSFSPLFTLKSLWNYPLNCLHVIMVLSCQNLPKLLNFWYVLNPLK